MHLLIYSVSEGSVDTSVDLFFTWLALLYTLVCVGHKSTAAINLPLLFAGNVSKKVGIRSYWVCLFYCPGTPNDLLLLICGLKSTFIICHSYLGY